MCKQQFDKLMDIIHDNYKSEVNFENYKKILYNKFIKKYIRKSSKGYLIIGKRITDDEDYFFIERTFRDNPNDRINEWKNRVGIHFYECADTVFGEKFAHAIFKKIRTSRISEKDATKKEIEWFTLNLTWDNINSIMEELISFIKFIAISKEIQKININTATFDELITLSSIGKSKANKIIKYRTDHKFYCIEDLMKIRGIGKATFNTINEFIVC